MTWEDMWEALNQLRPAALRTHKRGSWYVDQAINIRSTEGLFIESPNESGVTPERAVEARWEELTTLPSDKYIGDYDSKSNRYRWGGFMWVKL